MFSGISLAHHSLFPCSSFLMSDDAVTSGLWSDMVMLLLGWGGCFLLLRSLQFCPCWYRLETKAILCLGLAVPDLHKSPQVPSPCTTDLFSSRKRPHSSSTETGSSKQTSGNQGSLLPVSISWLLVALNVCRTEGEICEQNGALTLALQACASWPLLEGIRSISTGL